MGTNLGRALLRVWALVGGGRVKECGRLFEEIWYLVSFFNDIATSIEQVGNNYTNSHEEITHGLSDRHSKSRNYGIFQKYGMQ